jgi:hypothetical protein
MFEQPFGKNLEIYCYRNFLVAEDLLYLDEKIREANDMDLWAGESGNTIDSGNWTNRNLFLDKSDEIVAIEEKIALSYNNSIFPIPPLKQQEVFRGVGPINRTKIGQGLSVHNDLGPPEMNLPVAHGLILYLNEDFEGGELYYPNLDIEISPERGMLVAHSAKDLYSHGVKEVTSGIRYGLTMFMNFATT